ncbi:Multi antimicrobial extrusion protein [Cynara cardunculus var. scolymus]|uniref:Protein DETOXIFICATION n=1 Tax=Cynara cardunculus var. scolymus TaxID=59895 RepID=A0A103XEK4_CYNCS|nr:Multi antimicrobial extrusion protein [Cynara cardunculus var. scolymus]
MDNGIQEKLIRREKEEEEGDLKGRIWVESTKIWRVALPGVISRVCAFGTIVVTQSFIGHISDIDLAGYALVQTLSVRFVNGILLGMSSATETLCGQAFGAGQHHMMGIYLQRSWIVDLITLTVLLPIFIFATQIFKLLGEDAAVANNSGYISLWFIPFVYNFVFSLTIQMYLQAQLKNMVIAWLSIAQFGIHIPLSLLFVRKLNLGVSGAMIALSMSSWILVIGEFIYIFGGWCPYSWRGFTVAAFKDLFPVVKLSISSGVMVCLELWYNAVLVLLAGYMADAEVAISAFSICLNINAWEFMISLGFLGAACVRVANELGRGNAKAAKFSIKVLLGTSIAIGVFFFFLCLAFRKKLAYLFTNDKRVADTVSDLSLLLSFSVLLNSIYPLDFLKVNSIVSYFGKPTLISRIFHALIQIMLSLGVAVGAGLQGTVAIVNLVCFYLIGIPMGALLGYLTNLEVKGIWIGMIGGVVTQTLALVYMAWRTDWDDQVKRASERLNRFYLKSSDEPDEQTH